MVIINSKLLLIAFSSFVFGYVISSWIGGLKMNKKRFDAIEYGHTIIYRENGVNMWRNKVHVRLNELYDENQKLKEANQDLQYKIGEVTNLLHKEIKTSKNAFYGLMQENKELRQKIAQLKNK